MQKGRQKFASIRKNPKPAYLARRVSGGPSVSIFRAEILKVDIKGSSVTLVDFYREQVVLHPGR